jgi:hypothetical protein
MHDLGSLRLTVAACHQHVVELREAVAIADRHPAATQALRLRVRASLSEAERVAQKLDFALLVLSLPERSAL